MSGCSEKERNRTRLGAGPGRRALPAALAQRVVGGRPGVARAEGTADVLPDGGGELPPRGFQALREPSWRSPGLSTSYSVIPIDTVQRAMISGGSDRVRVELGDHAVRKRSPRVANLARVLREQGFSYKDAYAAGNAMRFDERREAGLCYRCGKRPPVRPNFACAPVRRVQPRRVQRHIPQEQGGPAVKTAISFLRKFCFGMSLIAPTHSQRSIALGVPSARQPLRPSVACDGARRL